MSLLGLLPVNGRVHAAAPSSRAQELVGLTGAALRQVRGKEIAVIFQEPMTALNPVYTIGFQIVETLRSHFDMSPKEAKERAIELLTLVEIPEPERRFDAYPHQLSGGQRQRAMIAQALACDPQLLIADEPTTALDVTVQAEILKLMRDLRERIDAGIVLITHDMGVVADMADRIVVMKHGRIVETGTADQIFNHAAAPLHPAAARRGAAPRQRVSAADGRGAHGERDARRRPEPRPGDAESTWSAENLVLEYPKRGNQPAFRAVDDVSPDRSAAARSSAWSASPARARPPSAARSSGCCRSPAARSRSPASA